MLCNVEAYNNPRLAWREPASFVYVPWQEQVQQDCMVSSSAQRMDMQIFQKVSEARAEVLAMVWVARGEAGGGRGTGRLRGIEA